MMKSPITKKSGQFYTIFYTKKHHRISCENRTILSPKHLRNRGFALAWTAIVISTLFLIVGLSIDVAKKLHNIHQLQNATDAAALAGAKIVKFDSPDDTRQFTHELGYANKAEQLEVTLRLGIDQEQPEPFFGDENSYDILLGRWVRYNRTFVPTLDAPNAVRAFARRNRVFDEAHPLRPLNFIFGPLAGVPKADADTFSVAWAYDSLGAGIICLSKTATPGLEITGTADIDVDGGGIHVNSIADGHNKKDGTWIHGSALIDTGFINTVGGVTPEPDSEDWEGLFLGGDDGVDGFSVSDVSTIPAPQHIFDPLAALMVDDPHVVVNTAEDYARLKVPEMLDTTDGGSIPTQYLRWNDSSSGYDMFSPANPTVYMRWDGSSYVEEPVEADPANPTGFNDPDHFSDTVGLAIRRDPVTGEPVLDLSTGGIIVDNPATVVDLPPGYYPNGMRLQNGDDVMLSPTSTSGVGTFFIWGGGEGGTEVGLYMSTGGSLTGHGVTCYATQNFSNGQSSVISMTGGVLDLLSPGDWLNEQNPPANQEEYLSRVNGLNGIAVWQDPTMLNSKGETPEVHLNGNGNFHISGTLYFPNPIHVRLEGNLGETGSQIICGSMEVHGTADFSISYDRRNQPEEFSRICLVQ